MKNLFALFLLLLLFGCKEKPHSSNDHSLDSSTLLEKKMKPYEYEYIKLFGLDPTKENIDFYKTSTKEAYLSSKSRNELFNGDWTIQGPGNIGGRVNAVATHPTNANIIYAGFARGGLWKTTDAGENWIPLWNKQPSQAVSAIAIDPNNTDIIYAGSGDVNISGNVFVGDGLYKSIDGGSNWEYIGLKETYIIGDILINPENTQQITVATMGLPFEENENRGIFYTEDGGLTWEQTLFIAGNTGVHDLAYNLQNPSVMLAGAWTRFRNGSVSKISGKDSKIYRSTDYGKTWKLASMDVPEVTGRTAVCFSEVDPNIAFAMYVGDDSDFQSLHKSTDAGETWVKIDEINDNTPNMMGGFAWFFGRIAYLKEPGTNNERLFLCGVDLWAFDEEILEWNRVSPPWWQYEVHADKHAIITDPNGDILLGTDGGLYRYYGNETWEDIEYIPNNMFYRVEYNPHDPYSYYGGMQDNGTSGGNESFINEWPRIWGGDGFQPRFHPTDPLSYYVETQNGNIAFTMDGGYFFSSLSLDTFSDDRRSWDMQYILSPHDPNVIYFGTHRAVKAINDFGNFELEGISEDLTNNDGSVIDEEVTALDESELEEGLLYFGTGDGNVWRSEQGVFVQIDDALPDYYVTSIKASPNNVDNVYATFSRYLFNDNSPRIYKSEDRGKTWQSISNGLPSGAVNDIVIYKEHNDSILFAATNVGVYATIDAGTTWELLGKSLPPIPVNDMAINVKNNEIIAGTFGRSINTYSIDSILVAFESNVIIATENEILDELRIYPNPAANYIQIDTKGQQITDIQIINYSGEIVKSVPQNNSDRISLIGLPAGSYYLSYKMNNKSNIKQFIKHD